jgi:hypothetical protein
MKERFQKCKSLSYMAKFVRAEEKGNRRAAAVVEVTVAEKQCNDQ